MEQSREKEWRPSIYLRVDISKEEHSGYLRLRSQTYLDLGVLAGLFIYGRISNHPKIHVFSEYFVSNSHTFFEFSHSITRILTGSRREYKESRYREPFMRFSSEWKRQLGNRQR